MTNKPIRKLTYDSKILEDICVDVYTKRLDGGMKARQRMEADPKIGPEKFRQWAQAYAPIVRIVLDCLNENAYENPN